MSATYINAESSLDYIYHNRKFSLATTTVVLQAIALWSNELVANCNRLKILQSTIQNNLDSKKCENDIIEMDNIIIKIIQLGNHFDDTLEKLKLKSINPFHDESYLKPHVSKYDHIVAECRQTFQTSSVFIKNIAIEKGIQLRSIDSNTFEDEDML